MEKIIVAYEQDRSHKNATRLVRHADKHPMSVCFLSAWEQQLITEARLQLQD